ncbi:MAG: hypothetical protein ACTS22_04230 [Phycisphaerales bacterium]
MSDIIPSTLVAKIEFFEQRLPDWAADPAAIGLTAAQISDLITRTAAARQAYNAAQQIRQESRNATAVQNDAVRSMASFGSDLIATIRAFADLQPDPNAVFQSAEINPPQPAGTPLPPPVPAADVRTQMNNAGAVTVSWTGTVANGTVYNIYRRFAQGSPYTLIGTSTTKRFVDATVPVGTAEASYYLVTLRDGMESEPSEAVSIRFGAVDPNPQAGTQAGGQTGGETQLGLAA